MNNHYQKEKRKEAVIKVRAELEEGKPYVRCFLKGKELAKYSRIGKAILHSDKINELEDSANEQFVMSKKN